jgi:hypothetical protein
VRILSIHVQISTALDDLERQDAPPLYEHLIERQIIRAMQVQLITIEEFEYYCARLSRICIGRRRNAA